LFPPRFVGNSFFFSSRFGRRPSFLFGRFPCFRASGCFFNGFTQVCFFEPVLRLFFFSAGFDPFLSGFGFRGDSLGIDDDLNSPGTMQPGIAMNSPTASPSADTSALGGENVPTNGRAKVDAAAEAADEAVHNAAGNCHELPDGKSQCGHICTGGRECTDQMAEQRSTQSPKRLTKRWERDSCWC
jgi:hypothetical protein